MLPESLRNNMTEQEKKAGSQVDAMSIDRAEQIVANRKRCSSLLQEADALFDDGSPEAAIVIYCKVLSVDPGRVPVIHKIGQCLEKNGASDDAALCYRGVLPDSVNLEYFGSDRLTKRMLSASECVKVDVVDAYPYDTVKLTAPRRNPLNDKKYGQFNYSKTEARASFCTIADHGSIWFDGFNTLALDSNGNVIEEHTKGNEFACYQALEGAMAIPVEGTVCFLDGRSSRIYYHWMLDVLPKLGALEKAGITLDSIDYFIVNAQSQYQIESLRHCGISPEKVITTPVPQYYVADTMIVPYLRNDLGERVYQGLGVGLARWIPDYLQRMLGPVSDNPESQEVSTSRIYVSRSSRGSRNIANEAEIVKALQARGFEIIEFEDYSVAGQAELMASADVVVGVHGAGFTNVSFCRPGTKVVEIFGDYVVPCYWALSAVADLEYAQFMAISLPVDAQTDNPGSIVAQMRDMQISVDLEEFITYLDSILEPCDELCDAPL